MSASEVIKSAISNEPSKAVEAMQSLIHDRVREVMNDRYFSHNEPAEAEPTTDDSSPVQEAIENEDEGARD